VWGALVVCMLSGCVSVPKGHSAETLQVAQSLGAQKQDFLLCSSEGLLALHMARSYISSNRDRNAVLPYIGPSTFDKELAAELFRRVDAGEIAYHFDFATDKLYACGARLGVPLPRPWTLARACYARLDLPLLYYATKQRRVPKADAIQTALKKTPDRKIYPEAMLVSLADETYKSDTEDDLRRLMETVFWRCMLAEKQVILNRKVQT
jgi:hypothetical protein